MEEEWIYLCFQASGKIQLVRRGTQRGSSEHSEDDLLVETLLLCTNNIRYTSAGRAHRAFWPRGRKTGRTEVYIVRAVRLRGDRITWIAGSC